VSTLTPIPDSPKRLIANAAAARHGVIDEALVLSRAECEDIVQRALKLSKADACRVSVGSSYQTNLRFADNQMSTSGISDDATISISSVFGKKRASVTTNDTSPEGLARAVAQAEALAKLSPDDPELMAELGAQTYATIPAWFDSTANLSAEDRARAALSALEPARKAKDLTVAGFIDCSANASAVGSSAGLFAYHRSTGCNYTLTVRTNDGTGSGWIGADENDFSRIDFNGIATRAIEKSRASRNPQAIEPGRYTVIFEPQAVSDLIGSVRGAMNARSADEGRSPFSVRGGGTRLGEKIVDQRVTLLTDPADPQILGSPFDGEGLPQGRQVWVENGVLKQLAYSRFWAQRKGVAATGGGGGGFGGGGGGGLKMLGGDSTIDAMIASTERAVLVTRLWYLRVVDGRTLVYTGLTRDGTFLIENGKVARSIKNFRFNDSPLFLLNNLEAVGQSVRVAEGGSVVPALRARDFSFTSLSDAV
jgi:predicted Zn-dependent protease